MKYSKLLCLATFACGIAATSVAVANKLCSLDTLRGTYGFYRTGSTPDGPLAAIGTVTYDGKGNFTATQSVSRNGNYNFDVEFSGTYTLNGHCAGAAFLDGAEFARMVVTDDGHGLYLLSESPGNAVYGVARRMRDEDLDH
jgi:hypothetical protein